ncbi:CDK-activating kinase assembly factor MAT1-domain-containing protein [Syncephalis fuscata]|nr:CDK-activating kinase assembly factor MAT1-domain-containing protein [Syncephalis fuscata]
MFARKRAELAPAYQDKNDKCPICRSERYMNTTMRLCDSCIDRLFAQGPAPCPVCHQILRKMAFAEPTFEDLGVEKEVRIRKRLAETFNKRPEDFATAREYNDYLEDVEELTFNMINEVDIEATEARIKEFQAANQDVILANHAKSKREEKQFDQQMEEELQARLRERQEIEREMTESERFKKKEKEEILKALATSEEPAAEVLAKRTALSLKRSSMRQKAENAQRLAIPPVASSPLADRVVTAMDTDRTVSFQLDDTEFIHLIIYMLFTHTVSNNAAAKAGGWTVDVLHQRALESALTTLFLPPVVKSTMLEDNNEINQ